MYLQSMYKKLDVFPEYIDGEELAKLNSLTQMNEQLIPKYTDYDDVDAYFDAYAIDGDRLDNLICPCYLHFAEDDMIIPMDDIASLSNNPDLHISTSKYGGHCGFLMNWNWQSWQDVRALEIIEG